MHLQSIATTAAKTTHQMGEIRPRTRHFPQIQTIAQTIRRSHRHMETSHGLAPKQGQRRTGIMAHPRSQKERRSPSRSVGETPRREKGAHTQKHREPNEERRTRRSPRQGIGQ
jgi:hypothetical protein